MKQNKFDKLLIKFQKFSLLPLIISLASFFACIVYHFANKQGAFLMFYFLNYCYFDLALFFSLSTLCIAIGLVCSLFAAKGKVIYLVIYAVLYLADFISIFFSSLEGNESLYVSSLLIHIAIMILLGIGLLFYFLAKKALIKEKQTKTISK